MADHAQHRTLPDERGQAAIVALGLVIVVAALGLAALLSVSLSNRSAVRNVGAAQSFYLAEAAMEYGVRYLMDHPDSLSFRTSGDLGRGRFVVRSDASSLPWRLVAEGSVGEARRVITLQFGRTQMVLPQYAKAIYSLDEVVGVSGRDEDGNTVDSLIVANASSLPPSIDGLQLAAEAAGQGHVYTGDFQPSSGYPNASFYYSQGVPNVTHVHGDLRVSGGRTVYGIFVVDGDVRLDGSARVEGVLFLPDSTSTMIHGGGNPLESSVTGSVISTGPVTGVGGHVNVRLNTEYLASFMVESNAEESYIDHVAFHSWLEE